MPSIFSRIIAGEIPSYKVAEDEHFYAFDLSDEEYAGLHLFAKRVAAALEKAMPCKRIATAVLGMEVPHAHIHLVPINKEDDMNFRAPKLQLSAERMAQIASAIASKFE